MTTTATTELQAQPRNIAGMLKSVDDANKAWLDQSKPKLDHAVGYFIHWDNLELIEYLRSKVGQAMNLVIAPDRVKDDKTDDGAFGASWWALRSEGTTEVVQAPPRPTPQPAPTPSRRPEGGNPFTPPPHIPNPAAVGACQNHAVDFITVGILQVPEGRTLPSFIREVRDRFYWEINQAPVEPRHFCYQHDMERTETTDGRWTHELPDQSVDGSDIVYFCIEGDEPTV